MPFSSLDPKAQKFVKKYFKSGGLFGKGTSDDQKDRMADEYQTWLNARSNFVLKLGGFPSYIGTETIVSDFKKANQLVEGDKKTLNADAATREVVRLSSALDRVGQQYVNRLETEAAQSVTRMQGMFGTVHHRKKAEDRLGELRTAGARTPPDFDAVRSAHAFILSEEIRVKKVSDDYKVEYDKFKGWPKIVRDRYPEINDPFVAGDKQVIEGLVKAAETKFDEHAISVARTLIRDAYGKVDAAKRLVKNRNEYEQVRIAAETEINKLLAKRNPGVEEECAEIVRLRGEAANQAAARDFLTPWHTMQDLKKRAVAALPAAQGYLDFEAAAKTASEAIDALAKHPQSAFAAGQIAEAKSVFSLAETLAGAGNYANAVNRLGMIPDMCKAAGEKAAGAATFQSFEADAKSEAPERMMLRADALLKSLENHPRAAQITEPIKELRSGYAAADKAVENFDDKTARERLEGLAKLAGITRQFADYVDALMTRAEQITQRVADLRDTHGQAKYAAESLKEASEAAKTGLDAASKGLDAATGHLDKAQNALDRARRLADGQEVFLIRRAEVKTASDDALKLTFPDKPATQSRIGDAFRRADEFSKQLDPVKAKGALEVVMGEVGAIKLAAKAKSGTPPTKQEVLDMIALPNGQRMLDNLIEKLGPNDVTQEVMVAMLGARFDMDVKIFRTKDKHDQGVAKTTLTGPAPNLLAYYKMMTKVPDAHTKLNESLLQFDEVEGPGETTSSFNSGGGKVVMGVAPVLNVGANDLSSPDQLENIDPDCVCVPDSQKAKPTHGTWTTLHEIGHAVDDAKSFMKGKAGNKDFGGWTEHGADYRKIALAVAAEYEFDAFYVERLISGGKPEDPDLPDDLKDKPDGATTWEGRKQKVIRWYNAMVTGADPWSNKRAPTDFNIGGRVYHEAYDDTWVSYDAAARRKGITGYQFRAPGEWFSELYAAYHTGKLNPKHPAAKWLSAL
ncbi:hypothetical protein [Albidovulum sediminis]|uniref:Uncharacterized protein n=1 Tax=Albidovulum sediminis TaxID=3066345 RepID=A0ABT2NLE7_9RHOB|nr:hypothetical protein [Defluviimonas sediminis]MCT8329738.1 hypothetical protein [Defluviimonas sediminis]